MKAWVSPFTGHSVIMINFRLMKFAGILTKVYTWKLYLPNAPWIHTIRTKHENTFKNTPPTENLIRGINLVVPTILT